MRMPLARIKSPSLLSPGLCARQEGEGEVTSLLSNLDRKLWRITLGLYLVTACASRGDVELSNEAWDFTFARNERGDFIRGNVMLKAIRVRAKQVIATLPKPLRRSAGTYALVDVYEAIKDESV